MSKFTSSRIMSSGLLAVLVAGAASSSVACSKEAEPEKQAAWSCTTEQVPMGEVLRCTSSAVTTAPPGATSTTVSYECGGFAATLADCPPAGIEASAPVGSDGTTGDTGGTGGAGAAGTDGSQTGSDGTTAGTSSGGTSGSGAVGSDGTTSVPGSGGGAGGSGTTNGSSDSGSSYPDECAYVPDLEYCAGSGGAGGSTGSGPVGSDGTTGGTSSSSGGTSGGASSSGGGSGGASSGALPPGQEKKAGSDGTTSGGASSGGGASSSSGGASSGGAASSSGSSGGGGGNGRHYTCTKDSSGNKSCTSTPDCAPGTHAAACGACVSDGDGPSDCVPPSEGGCWVTGGGFIEAASLTPAAAADGHDNFGGNAKPMKGGNVSGHWNHVDHGTGNHAKGRPEYIMCRHVDEPGPGQPGGKKGLTANQVYFGGHAQWRTGDVWNDGYWFDVVAKDHGEPGSTNAAAKKGMMADTYHFTIRKIDDPAKGASGTLVYETRGDLNGGNIQMHASNNGHPAVNSPLPAWVSLEP